MTLEYLCCWVYYHELAHSSFSSEGNNEFRHFGESTEPPVQTSNSECTGTLAADASGFVYHGRNMDNSPASIRNVTVHIKFIKNNTIITEGIDYYWFNTGVMTAYKAGVASVSENWRGGY